MDPKPYLDYLDKEMTIMGILSAFAVAAPAGILVTSIGKDSQIAGQFWNSAEIFIVFGSIYCVVAALLFYKQRSTLAWYYGQIALVQSTIPSESLDEGLKEWFREADSWATWWSYCCAFTALTGGFASYFFAVLIFLTQRHTHMPSARISAAEHIFFWSALIIMLCSAATQSYVRFKYRYEDFAWTAFWNALRRGR